MSISEKKVYVGVIGAGHCTSKLKQVAFEVGKEIAKAKAILVCGGLGGTMEGAAEGAKSSKGTTIGIIPGDDKIEANQHIDFVICSGLGEVRNLLIIKTADVVIALPGMYGTLSEIGFALMLKKPLISLGSWEVDEKIIRAKSPKEAVQLALQAIQK